jgi:hypothetical protein
MAIAFRSVNSVAYASHSSTVIPAPSGIANDDILIAAIAIGRSGSDPGPSTPPAGFTAVTTATWVQGGSFYVNLGVYWKRAASESGSYTFTHSTYSTEGVMLAYSGCLTSGSPIDSGISTQDGAGGTSTLSSITTTVANAMLLAVGQNWDANGSTPPSGMTERFDHLITVDDVIQASAGASGTKTINPNGTTSGNWQAWLFALKPAAGGAVSADAGSQTITASVDQVTVDTGGIALVQSAEGTSSLATTTASFSGATTSGNLVVLCFAADDYNGSPDSGWTQSSEMEQQTFHGGYLWWRISTGETDFDYTIGSASGSSWILQEFSGVDATPYDTSQGKFQQTSAGSLISDSIVPSTGNRVLVAMLGASFGSSAAAITGSFDSSFTLIRDIGNNIGATRDFVTTAYRLVTGNGSTGYTTTGTHSGANSDSRSSLVISFKAAAGGGVNADVTTNLLTTSVGAATVQAKANVSPTTNVATVSVDQVTVAAKANVTFTLGVISAFVSGVTVQAKANVSPTTNLLTTSVDQVTIDTGPSAGVDVNVTGQTLTASVDAVVASGAANVTTTTNLLTTSVNGATVQARTSVTVEGQVVTAAVDQATVTGRANVSPTTNLLTTSISGVTATAGATASVTTNLLTASVGQVTVNAIANVNVNVTTNLLSVSVGQVAVEDDSGIVIPVYARRKQMLSNPPRMMGN